MKVINCDSFDANITPEQVNPELKGLPFERVVMKKPMLPKLARVKNFIQVGDRKWATVYRIRDESSKICFTVDKFHEAVKQAKQMAIENIKSYYITIDKTLINADPRVAVVTPGKNYKGKFKFIILDK